MCFKLEDRQAFRNLELASTGLPERIPFPFVWYGKEDQTESNMIRVVIAGVAAALTVSGAAHAQDKASKTFLPKAIEGNFAEVEMGKLAQSNGQSEGVKSFGKMLVTDHSAANEKAIAVAKSLNVTAPTAPNAKQKADHDKMAKMKGAEFDKMFAEDMVADHKKDIKEYQAESKVNDAAGQYAKDSLPVLQKHLETAQSLQKK